MQARKNILPTVLRILLLGLSLCFALLSAVACDNAQKYFRITTEFDNAKGSVTVSEPQNEAGYLEGEEVVVTVSATEGYEVEKFTVNGAEKDLSDGKYTFKITGDTSIEVTFKEKTVEPPVDEKFTVTVNFDNSAGSATLSPTVENHIYIKDTKVTLSVEANDGFVVKSVTVNGTIVALDENGCYSFTVTGNTEIEVLFEEKTAPAPENDTFEQAFCGDWESADGLHSMSITETDFTFDGEEAVRIEKGGSGDGVFYNVDTKQETYNLGWLNGQTGVVLSVYIGDSNEEILFIKAGSDLLGGRGIDDAIQGIWGYDRDGDDNADKDGSPVMKITSKTVSLDEKTSTRVIRTDYVGSNGEKYYNYNFYIDSEKHVLKWVLNTDKDTGGYYYLTLDGEPIARDREAIYFNDSMQGRYKALNETGEMVVIIITEDSVRIGDEKVIVGGEYGGYTVTYKGVTYQIRLYPGSESLLYLRIEEYGEDGLIKSTKDTYFLKEGTQLPEIEIDERLFGTWAQERSVLVIDESKILWDNQEAIILSENIAQSSVFYRLILNGAIYELEYSGGDALNLSCPGEAYTFIRELEAQGEAGFLGLTIDIYTIGSDATLTVKKDSLTIYLALYDSTITLKLSDLTKTDEGYTFVWNELGGADQPMILIIGTDENTGKPTLTIRDTTTEPDEEGKYYYHIIYTFMLA